jgi:site-specific DNA-methyltransferase (adenine-specific)
MKYLITLITPPGGVVLDPFAGSGTTGVACIELGFGFRGYEQDPEFHAYARKRMLAALEAQE